MKLHKRLFINDQRINLVCEKISTDLFNPGRAVFTVDFDQNDIENVQSGKIQFFTSYDKNNLKSWFIGFIESCTQVDSRQYNLFCREYSATLYYSLPLALRDTTLQNILSKISNDTGLGFETPSANTLYLSNRTPVFYNTGCGYSALDNIGKIFSIDRYFWRQQPNGSIYVGSWSDHSLSQKPIPLNRKFETDVLISEGARIPAIPALTPGVLYNESIITQVEFEKNHMRLHWSKNPWRERT